MGLILDTNFIVTAEREAKRGILGRADAFLAAHPTETFHITFTIAGELACGKSAAAMAQWKRLCQPYSILPWSIDISWQYGEIYRHLAENGTLIGTNDLWIAATAIVHDMAVVTQNLNEFQRVPCLNVLPF
jgi:predicted nucleic acid-binding protein